MDAPEPAPGWMLTVGTLLLGAGGAKMLEIWLENRRLTKKDYRETLAARIATLEAAVAALQALVADVRVENARLEGALQAAEERNLELESRLQDCRDALDSADGSDGDALPQLPG